MASKSKFMSCPSTSCQDKFSNRVTNTSEIAEPPNRKYRFIKNLGHGSDSTLYEAVEISTGTLVIIKKIKKSRKYAWINELRILERSRNVPGDIVRLVDFYENPMNSYIVMLAMPGTNFFKFVIKHSPIPEQKALPLFLKMAESVKACHDAGILHLDIKCENFVICSSPGLIDFGHSTWVPDITKIYRGRLYGTKYFRCPEGHRLTMYSSKSDIWSLGACLCLMLTGHFPFHETKTKTFYDCALDNDFSIKIPPAGLSPGAVELIKACLDRNPSARPTAENLVRVLESVISARQ